MHVLMKIALTLTGMAWGAASFGQATFYEGEGFRGRSLTAQRLVPDLHQSGFNDRASSAIVTGDPWEACEDAGFRGRCVVLRPGQYPSLQAMGLNDRLSSVRAVNRHTQVDDSRYAPYPIVDRDYRRRGGEALYEAPVISVRAIIGMPEQRCWIEHEQVPQEQRDNRVPAAVLGAVIGGILGHQIGGGSGRDLATVGGAVAGAAVGSNMGRDRDGRPMGSREVQRCASVPSQAAPDFWDVTYIFRGVEHHVQLARPPGRTVTVNRRGEPRG